MRENAFVNTNIEENTILFKIKISQEKIKKMFMVIKMGKW